MCIRLIQHVVKFITSLGVPPRMAFFSWLPASRATKFDSSCESFRNIQLIKSPKCIFLLYFCIQTHKSDIMQLHYTHKLSNLLSFCFLSFLISCGPHISCEQSLQARGEKASLLSGLQGSGKIVGNYQLFSIGSFGKYSVFW